MRVVVWNIGFSHSLSKRILAKWGVFYIKKSILLCVLIKKSNM